MKITYGLLNVKNITVPTERLQAVVEKQSFIRKLFGYTSIYFIITSDLEVKSNEDVSENGKIVWIVIVVLPSVVDRSPPILPNGIP